MVKLSVATKDSYKNDKGERITDTTWHNLIFWGVQAKLAEDLLKKGDEVTIEGKLTNRNYVDKEGIKRYVSEIVVNDFLKMGGKA